MKHPYIIAIDPSVYNVENITRAQLADDHPLKGALIVCLKRIRWGADTFEPIRIITTETLSDEQMAELLQWFEPLHKVSEDDTVAFITNDLTKPNAQIP